MRLSLSANIKFKAQKKLKIENVRTACGSGRVVARLKAEG